MECDAEKLLHLIEERPAIYNYKLKEHSSRVFIDKLWEEIAEEMNLPANECRNKWKCLRSSFNRVVREGRQNTASGSKKKKWYLLDAMQFLNDFVGVHRNLGSNMEETSSETLSNVTQSDIPVTLKLKRPESLGQSDELICQSAPTRKKVEPVFGPMIQYLKSTKSSTDRENPTLAFFKSLVPDVDKLSESKKRKFKQSVMNLLYQILEDQEKCS